MAAKIEGLSRATFSELAPILADFGYHVVPIRPGSKAPEGIAGWQTPRAPDYYLPRHGDWATGILTATSPAIDLDIRDRGIVKMLIRLAEEVLERGPSPIRVGQPPKALLPFSTDEPFDKVMSRWFALPGEDFTAVGFKAHRVEVLGDGQQFVAFGRHPRGSYYRWVRGSLLTYHAVDLAPIDQPQAQAFVDAAENIMLAAGMIPLVLQGGRYRLDLPRATPPTPPPRRRPLQAPETVPSWQFMSPGEVARAIDPETARGAPDGSWRLRCPVHRGNHRDSLSIARGRDQALVWKCFADCPQREIAARISEIVR
jgi:hypothetical protein